MTQVTWLDVVPFAASLDRDITRKEARIMITWFNEEMRVFRQVHQPVMQIFTRERRVNARRQGCWRWVGRYRVRAVARSGALYGDPIEVCAWADKGDTTRHTRAAAFKAAVEYAQERIKLLSVAPTHEAGPVHDLSDVPAAERAKFEPDAQLRFVEHSDATPSLFEPGDLLEVIGPNSDGGIDAVRLSDHVIDMVHWHEVELVRTADREGIETTDQDTLTPRVP